jgi:Arabinose efflux permease
MPHSAIPEARTALFLMLAINLFNYLDRQVLAAVVPYIRTEFFGPGKETGPVVEFFLMLLRPFFGANPENAMIGLLNMAFMVVYMLAAPKFASLNWKRWQIVAFGVIIWSLASGASGLATTFGMLLLTRCFVGIGEAAYGPVAPTMLADLYSVEQRGKVMSWFYVAIPVGSALGFVYGGAVASLLDWHWAFYLVVPPGLLLGLWCLRQRDTREAAARDKQLGPQEAPKKLTFANVKQLMSIRSYVFNTIGMTCMTFAIGGVGFWVPSYIYEFRHEGTLTSVNLTFGVILVLAGILGTLAGGIVADKLRDRIKGAYFKVSAAAMILSFPFWVGMIYLPFPWAWLCIFGACFCLFFNTGPTNTIIANVTSPGIRAGAFAFNILIIHAFGDVLSPMIVGGLTDAWGSMSKAFLVVAAMAVIGGVFWWLGAHYLEEDTKRALE